MTTTTSKNTSFKRGFTIIELLVVIAIIGILSSIVLTSVNQAREKGKDAAAKADLQGVRAQASLYFDSNNQSFGSDGLDCSNPGSVFDPTLADNVNTLVLSAALAVNSTPVCANSTTAYVVAVPLIAGTNWCVDSTGYASTTDIVLTGTGSIQERVACQ